MMNIKTQKLLQHKYIYVYIQSNPKLHEWIHHKTSPESNHASFEKRRKVITLRDLTPCVLLPTPRNNKTEEWFAIFFAYTLWKQWVDESHTRIPAARVVVLNRICVCVYRVVDTWKVLPLMALLYSVEIMIIFNFIKKRKK